MPTEPELLQAVLAKPDDDAPRLEYAKWCESQTDPLAKERGEFIRLQLKLARTPFDPNQLTSWRDLDRTKALLARHRDRWAGFVAQRATEIEFHRGFVARIKIALPVLLDIATTIFSTQPVQHLDVTDLQPSPDRLFTHPLLEKIRSLSIENAGLTDEQVTALADSQHVLRLRWLSLRNNAVTRTGVEALARTRNLPSLEVALLDGNPCDPREQYGADNDTVTARWMPEEGRQLETMFGPLRWLRGAADTVSGWIPPRLT